jgi:hypothetical protein
MNEVISEVATVFGKVFPLRYKDALIASIRLAEAEACEVSQLLPPTSAPAYPLKEGIMEKRGDIVKNWKTRHFVALNKADNFVIHYSNKEGGKAKGTINCCGYRACEFSEVDAREFGDKEHAAGIKLVPYNERRRVWYVRCSTAQDQEEWLRIFNNACSKAAPPVNKNPVLAAAFEGAYRAIRWNYEYYGWYAIGGTEAETLAGLTSDILDRELINDILYNIPAGPSRHAACESVRRVADTAVQEAISVCWNCVANVCERLTPSVEASVRSLLKPLLVHEGAVKDKIVNSISGTVGPFISDVGGRVCRPMLRQIVTPITKAFCAGIEGYAINMREKIKNRNFEEAIFTSSIQWADREIEYWWSGPLEHTNQICWGLYTTDLTDVACLFSARGFTPYSVYADTLESIRDLLHRAHHQFAVRAMEGGYAGLEGILIEVRSLCYATIYFNLIDTYMLVYISLFIDFINLQ